MRHIFENKQLSDITIDSHSYLINEYIPKFTIITWRFSLSFKIVHLREMYRLFLASVSAIILEQYL